MRFGWPRVHVALPEFDARMGAMFTDLPVFTDAVSTGKSVNMAPRATEPQAEDGDAERREREGLFSVNV